ncbi:Myo-inositol-1-phosphate synthase [Friedmanniomyces endolithicus]|nr:Myo-inositol-1-phosphate synthase [Friedmanniomyces endolithicus]
MAPHANDSNGIATATGFAVESPNVTYGDGTINARYTYRTTDVSFADGKYQAKPKETVYDFKTQTEVGKVGLMLVGLGGNNGSTVTAGILANRRKLEWETREGPRKANYYGSVVMSSTVKLGTDTETGKTSTSLSTTCCPWHTLKISSSEGGTLAVLTSRPLWIEPRY